MLRPPKVLVVEDDRLERMNLSHVLVREGFDLSVAATAAEAYSFLVRERFEVVLTDIGLPDESGFEVLHAAKRVDPETKVVLLTGSQTTLTPEQATGEGAAFLLLKPFALADLILAVRRLAAWPAPPPVESPFREVPPSEGPEPAA